MIVAIVDVETTGLDYKNGGITEFGLVLWDTSAKRPLFMYSGLNDPGIPISEAAGAISGISDDMVKGQVLHKDLIELQVARAEYIVAHNAIFDMGFVITEFGKEGPFRPDRWLCSLYLINWKRHRPRTTSRAVVHLGADIGVVNLIAHQALADSLMLTAIISDEMFEEMVAKGKCRWAQIRAINTPIETRGLLREHGYRCLYQNNSFQYWYINVPDYHKEIDVQMHFLEEEIYPRQMMLRYKAQERHPAVVKYYDHWYEIAAIEQKEMRNA